MNKGQQRELILRSLEGGDLNPDFIQRFHPDEVDLFIDMALADIIRQIIEKDEAEGKTGWNSSFDSLLKYFKDVPVTCDLDECSSDLPAELISLPENGAIRDIVAKATDFDYGQIFSSDSRIEESRLPVGNTTSVSISPDGRYVAVGMDTGLWIYDRVYGKSELVTQDTFVQGDVMPTDFVNDVSVGYRNIFYVGTDLGLWEYNYQGNRGKLYTDLMSASDEGMGSLKVLSVDAANNSQTVIAQLESGAWIYDQRGHEKKGIMIRTDYPPANGVPIKYDQTQCVCVSQTSGLCLIGTGYGAYLYEIQTDTGWWTDTTTPVSSGSPLPSDNILAVYVDDHNNQLFLGTDASVWKYIMDTEEGYIFSTAAVTQDLNGCPSRNELYITIPNQLLVANLKNNTFDPAKYIPGTPVDKGDTPPAGLFDLFDVWCKGDVTVVKYSDINSVWLLDRQYKEDMEQVELIYQENFAQKVFQHLEVNKVNTIPTYRVEGNKIIYDFKDSWFELVDMRLIPSFADLGDEDQVNIPEGFDAQLVEMVKQMMLSRMPRDKTLDQGEPEQKVLQQPNRQ